MSATEEALKAATDAVIARYVARIAADPSDWIDATIAGLVELRFVFASAA